MFRPNERMLDFEFEIPLIHSNHIRTKVGKVYSDLTQFDFEMVICLILMSSFLH